MRFEPGEGSTVRGYLLEGEIVTITDEQVELEGSTWQKISHPIEGWVNEKYLCSG